MIGSLGVSLGGYDSFPVLAGTGHFATSTFSNKRIRKQVGASVRRPGKLTANKFPSCTKAQARKFDIRYKPRKRAEIVYKHKG